MSEVSLVPLAEQHRVGADRIGAYAALGGDDGAGQSITEHLAQIRKVAAEQFAAIERMDTLCQRTGFHQGHPVRQAVEPDLRRERYVVDPLARFVMTLASSSKYVTRIDLPTDEPAAWHFDYRLVNDHLCMSAVETPSGGREEMFYQDLGHQFPASSVRKPLPRVTRHLSHPGFEQPSIDVRYTYKSEVPGESEKNFLGGGLTLSWADNGLDNLYQYIGNYVYVCIESLWVTLRPGKRLHQHFDKGAFTLDREQGLARVILDPIQNLMRSAEWLVAECQFVPGG